MATALWRVPNQGTSIDAQIPLGFKAASPPPVLQAEDQLLVAVQNIEDELDQLGWKGGCWKGVPGGHHPCT